MPSTLDYARKQPKVRSLAIPALICGALSGPAAFGLAFLGGRSQLDEQMKGRLVLWSLIGVLGAAFAFSCVVRGRLPRAASGSMRLVANLAIAAPILWTVAIFALITYMASQI